MKASKFLAAGILAGAALISTASAQQKIYITGSTAFRSVTNTQISAVLSGTVTIASTNATLGSANGVNWTGGNIGGTAVTIKAAWTGSAAGIQSVAANNISTAPTKFLKDGATGTSNADPNGTTPDSPESAIPDVCMADNLQSSTVFNGGTYASLTDIPVGIVSFTWAASKNFPLNGGTASVSNYSMSKKVAQQLLSGGAVPLGAFTGLAADQASLSVPPARVAYASGRNPDSGTRIITLAESGYGVASFVKQYKPTVGSGATDGFITNLTLYPTETINGISTVVDGNSGESSGSTLRAYLTNQLTAANFTGGSLPNSETGPSFIVTYLGTSDFNSVSGSGAVALGWNGVSVSQTAIINGAYTFWGTERLMYRSTLGNGTTGGPAVKLTFATNLKTNILAATSATLSPNVKLSDMLVDRAGDGGDISNPNF